MLCMAPGRGHRLGQLPAVTLTRWSRRAIACCSSTVRVGQKRCYRQQRLAFGSQCPDSEKRGRSAGDRISPSAGQLDGRHGARGLHSELAGAWRAGADGRGDRRMEPVYADADGGITAAEPPYREPTIENRVKMMSIFVFDTRDLTEALFRGASQQYAVASRSSGNLRQSLRPTRSSFLTLAPAGEITAPTPRSSGTQRPLRADGCRVAPARWDRRFRNRIFTATAATGPREHADSFNQLVLNFSHGP